MDSRNHILSKYPLQLQLNFIDLFKVDIINRLDQNANLWKEFSCVVGDAVIEEYSIKHIDAETRELKHDISEELYAAMIKSERADLLYYQLIEFLEIVDQELYQSLCIDNWKEETFLAPFQKLLNILHKICPVFDIKCVVDNLRQYSTELADHYQPVIKQWEDKKIDDEHAKSLIIRTLCTMVHGATYHLLYAIHKSSDEAKDLIEGIYPNFEIFYQKNVFENREGIVYFVNNGDNIADAIEDIMSNGNESKHAHNLFFGNVAPYHLRSLLYKNTEDDAMNLRAYQYELVEKALKGENTLICAPTGSGKTIVAAYIIREHICERWKNHKMAKIVFVVPKGILVEQQIKQLKTFLGHCVAIDGLYGGCENIDLQSLINSVDIIVLTPKILENATNPTLCTYVGIEPVSMDVFSMIVLDEVHHTDKEDLYNELMKEYHRCKYDDFCIPFRPMPQVIGLTASLGTPKEPKSVDHVINYMINKCANCDIRSYTTVTKNTEELHSWISKTKENTIIVENNDKLVNEYFNYLRNLIKNVEKYLMNIDGILRYPEIFHGYCDIKSIEYKQWLSITRLTTLKKVNLSPSAKIKAIECLEYLDIFYEAYQCAKLFPTEDTTKFYLKNLFKENGSDLDELVFDGIKKLEELPCSKPDIFKELVKCITDQFNKDPGSKIIIFAPQRYYCRLGSEIIETYTSKKGLFISGSNAASEEAGCTPIKQSEIVKKFKNGEVQILFATSVLDEGIDVAECNLVIKYNFVTDNIAHVQRKGRARKALSESILITYEEKKEEKEEKHKDNIQMIKKAYDTLEKMSPEEKLLMFDNAIIESNQKRIKKEKKKAELKEKMSPRNANFTLKCSKCDAYITDSSNIRLCDNQFVPYDSEIWKRVKLNPSTPDEYNEEYRGGIIGRIFCNNVLADGQLCNGNIGRGFNFKGILLPTLTCEQIIFVEKESNEIKTPRKWKKLFEDLFYPNDISYDELLAMKTFVCQPNLEEVVESIGKASLAAYGVLYDQSSSDDDED